MKLKDLQISFVNAITHKQIADSFAEEVIPGGKLESAKSSLSVYQNGYPARLSEALGETYEGVWSVLGDHEFITLCQIFSSQFYSRSYNLSDYDERFSIFLEKQERLLEDFPFLPELARFEWAFHEVFHEAPDQVTSLLQDELEKVNETSTFDFLSSLRFFAFEYSSYSIWKSRQENSSVPFGFKKPEFVLLYKVGNQMIRSLSLDEWQFKAIQKLHSKKTLGQTLEEVAADYDLNENSISSLFATLVTNQLIVRIHH